MNNLIRLELENNVICFFDYKNKEVYSAKLKKLKGLKHARTNVPYFILQYNGHKITKSLNQLVRLADEILRQSH